MFLGKRKYEEALELLKRNSDWNKEDEKEELKYINREKKGDILFCMWCLGDRYLGRASMNLLNEKDMKRFREDCYIYAKLNLMGEKGTGVLNVISILEIFPLICSNNKDLWEFVMRNRDCMVKIKKLTKSDEKPFLSRTIITAMRGEWEEVIKLCDTYLSKELTKYEIDFKFLKALALKDIDEMKEQITAMFEPKRTRRLQNEASIYFDFYLQMYVIIYAKIALYHGIDLEIDCEEAPKEVISNESLEKYEEPYEFMKEFNLKEIGCKEWNEWIEKQTKKL